MHRPLRVPLYVRVWQFVKNLLVLNRVDWHKASDGLNMPTLSREERELRRPKADLEIIKPRDKPRARIDAFRGAQVSKPVQLSQVSEPPASLEESGTGQSKDQPTDSNHPEGQYIKRRRYKRRRTSSKAGGDGFFHRVFGK